MTVSDSLTQVYGGPTDPNAKDWLDELSHISHPYDPLLVLALLSPNLFTAHEVRPKGSKLVHRMIGMEPGGDNLGGVADAKKVRRLLLRRVGGLPLASRSAASRLSSPQPKIVVSPDLTCNDIVI